MKNRLGWVLAVCFLSLFLIGINELPVNIRIESVAPQLDDTDKIAVSLYGADSAAGDTAVAVNSSGEIPISTSVDLTVTLDSEVAAVDATGQGDVPISTSRELTVTLDSEVVAVDAANFGKAESSTHTTADVGVMLLGIRHDDVQAPTAADGEYTPVNINESGILRTQAQQHLHIDAMGATTGWSPLNTDTVNVETTVNHVVGTAALEFDKTDGAAGTVFGVITKTISSMDMTPYEKGNGFFLWTIYLSDLTEVNYVLLRLGTDISNYNEWRVDEDVLIVGWNSLRMGLFNPSTYAGNGWNSAAVTHVAVGVAFDAEDDELLEIAVDHLSVNSGLLTSTDIVAEVSSSVSTPNVNMLKVGNKVVDTDSGTTGAGTQRVILASDQDAVATTSALGATSAKQLADGHNVTVDGMPDERATSTGAKAADFACKASAGTLMGVIMTPDGVNDFTITIYDDPDSADGNVLFKTTIAGDGLPFVATGLETIATLGIYADGAVGAGTFEFVVLYR